MDRTNEQNKPIAITGVGIVSPIGIGKESFFRNLRDGVSGIREVSLFKSDRPRLAAEITDFDPRELMPEFSPRNLDRTTLLLLAAAKYAIEDGNLSQGHFDPEQIGLFGTSSGAWVCADTVAASDAIAFLVFEVGPVEDVADQQASVTRYRMKWSDEDFTDAEVDAAAAFNLRVFRAVMKQEGWAELEPDLEPARAARWSSYVMRSPVTVSTTSTISSL